MPIIKAAIKHLRQSEKRRVVNRAAKTRLKDALKEIKRLAQQKKAGDFAKRLPAVTSLIDKAVKQNLIHKNNAARRKSLLARLLTASS